MKYEVNKLRPRSFYDYILIAIKSLAGLISILLLIYIFLDLLLSAIKSPAAFARTVLMLALITIAFVIALILLNVFQKILYNRLEQRRQNKLERANTLFTRLQRDPSGKLTKNSFRGFLKHLNILESAANERLSGSENEKVRLILIQLGAGDVLEKQARRSRLKWRQIQALSLLGWLRPNKNLPLLNEALYDPDRDIIATAVSSLAKYSDVRAYRLLLEALDAERLPLSRLTSFIEISNCKNKLPLLIEQARNSNPKVRFWIAYLLGKTGRPEALTILASLSKDRDYNVRVGAAQALGELGDKRGIALTKTLLQDDEWPVRLHAAKAAGDLRAEELIPDLIKLLKDSQWWVRENSALALERFGPVAIPYLKDLLTSDDRFAENKAAEILGRLGVIEEQIGKLTASPREANSAHKFLVTVGRAEAINIIEVAAINAEPEISIKLIGILGEIGNPDAETTLKYLTRGQFDDQVKKEADETLKILKVKGAA